MDGKRKDAEPLVPALVRFDPAYARTNAHEGGISDHPDDRGGLTYRGISRAFHPAWPGWTFVDAVLHNDKDFEDVENTLDVFHKAFFFTEFWQALHLDRWPASLQSLANEMYDSAVNLGRYTAARWLQLAMNGLNRRGRRWPDIKVDGRVGPVTTRVLLQACTQGYDHKLLKLLNAQQGVYYLTRTIEDESQEEFLSGWLERVWDGD